MDLIDTRDEILRIFKHHGISENKENNLTELDLIECSEAIVKSINKDVILNIVDRCFHVYASSYRNEGKKEASKIIDRLLDEL